MACSEEESATTRRQMCEEICQRLQDSELKAQEPWQRELEVEVAMEFMQYAHSAVFDIWVNRVVHRAKGKRRLKVVHFAAIYGRRAVLELACARTSEDMAEAAMTFDADGNTLLHVAMSNKQLSVEDVRWVASLHPAAAGTPNNAGNLPLHLLLAETHEALLSWERLEALVEAYPPALQSANHDGDLPLHTACTNPQLPLSALRQLVSLHAAAASTPNSIGNLPLHLLVWIHTALTPEMVDIVMEAYPHAPRSANHNGDLPLHSACCNSKLTLLALCRLVSLNPAAAGTRNQRGDLPLHLLVWIHKSLTPTLVHVLLEAHPQAAKTTDQEDNLPLRNAADNPYMTVDGFHSVLRAFPAAAFTPQGLGLLPYHAMHEAMPDGLRSQLVKLIVATTDSQFACESTCPHGAAAAQLPPGPGYVPPPPDARWASRAHPLSRQGRLKVGLRVAVRGRENVWQFQTGGSLPGRETVDRMSFAELVQLGHRSLVRQRLDQSPTMDVASMNSAVLRALELGHADVVRDLLTAGSFSVSCSKDQVCEWLGVLMRHKHQDHSWLVQWMGEQREILGDVNLDWFCLEATAFSGDLALVESVATAWWAVYGRRWTTDEASEELAQRAMLSGNLAVLHWLQKVGLATHPNRPVTLEPLVPALTKHDRLELLEGLYSKLCWYPGGRIVQHAAEHGAIRLLRWLHVHTRIRMNADDMALAIHHGHIAVVQFLHRHRNITCASLGDSVLAEAVRYSPPGTLEVVEYVLRHHLCGSGNGGGDDAVVTERTVVNACTATTVRVDVVQHLVGRASEDVLQMVDDNLTRRGSRQAQVVFRAARLRLQQEAPAVQS